ncbi:MAG: T9SS type A sorting domain-containing protein [Calditrichota bacterium]
MKTIHLTLMIVIFFAFAMFSQANYPLEIASSNGIYRVTPGSHHNRISLTVANESLQGSAGQVAVQLVKHSPVLIFPESVGVLENLASGQEAEVTFFSIVLEYTPPRTYALEQNYPNPFNPVTKIQYQLPEEVKVRLEVYDILGRKVATLLDRRIPAGYHEVSFDASSLASGVYIYRLVAGSFTKTHKMMVMK